MSLRNKLPILLVIFMAVVIAVAWFLYGTFYAQKEEISRSYIESYQELEPSDVRSITIDTVNHKVIIRPSNDEKVRLSYYQRPENSNSLTNDSGVITLKIIEKAEDMDNLFYRSKRQIDTVTVYVPEDSAINITVRSSYGPVNVDEVQLGNLVLSSSTGNFTVSKLTSKELNMSSTAGFSHIEDSVCGKITVSSNSGEIIISNSDFTHLNASNVTGNIRAELVDSLENYRAGFNTLYGILTINGERVTETDEEGKSITVNEYTSSPENAKKDITLTGVRNSVEVTSNETPPEIPAESGEETNSQQ